MIESYSFILGAAPFEGIKHSIIEIKGNTTIQKVWVYSDGGVIYSSGLATKISIGPGAFVYNVTSVTGKGGVLYTDSASEINFLGGVYKMVSVYQTREGSVLFCSSPQAIVNIRNNFFSRFDGPPDPSIDLFPYEIGAYSWKWVRYPELVTFTDVEESIDNGNLFSFNCGKQIISDSNHFKFLYTGAMTSVYYVYDSQFVINNDRAAQSITFQDRNNEYDTIYAYYSVILRCDFCSEVLVQGSTFNNTRSLQGPLFEISSSYGDIRILNCTFNNLHSLSTSALFITREDYIQCDIQTELVLDNLRISNIYAVGNGGFVCNQDLTRKIRISNLEIENSFNSGSGGFLASKGSSVEMANLTATNISAIFRGTLITMTPPLFQSMCYPFIATIKNVSIDGANQLIGNSVIYVENVLSLIIDSLHVSNFYGINENCGVFARQVLNFQDTNSSYAHLRCTQAGVYMLQSVRQVAISNVRAENISINYEGCFMTLTDEFIEANVENVSVSRISQSNYQDIGLTKQGAAIHVKFMPAFIPPKISIKSSLFEDVYIPGLGGIFYAQQINDFSSEEESIQIDILDSVFKNITANIGGIAYFDSKVSPILEFKSSQLDALFSNQLLDVRAVQQGSIIYATSINSQILADKVLVRCQEGYSSTFEEIYAKAMNQHTQEGGFYLENSKEGLTLTNSLFENCQDYNRATAASIRNSVIKSVNNTFRNNFARSAGVFYVSMSQFTSINDTFIENKAEYAGVFQLDNDIFAEIQNAFIEGSLALFKGGVLQIGKSSLLDVAQIVNLQGPNFTIKNCQAFDGGIFYLASQEAQLYLNLVIVSNSSAADRGGMIYAQSGKLFQTRDCQFIDSSSQIGGFLYSEYSGFQIMIEQTSFTCLRVTSNQVRTESFFFVFKSQNFISQSNLFQNCVSSKSNGIITLKQSSFNDTNSRFENLRGLTGGVISSSQSTIYLKGSQLINNSAEQGGAISLTEYSTLIADSCEFKSNRASISGGVLLSQANSVIKLYSSHFEENSSENDNSLFDILSSQTSQLNIISNCTFVSNSAKRSAISFLHSQILIEDSTFENNQALLWSQNIFVSFSNLTVKRTDFYQNDESQDNFEQIQGSYIYVLFDVNLEVSDSVFRNGRAQSGGAVYIQGLGKSLFQNCNFENNIASSQGGAVFATNFDYLIFEQSTKFIENFSEGEGDDVYISGFSSSVIFQDVEVENSKANTSIVINFAQMEVIRSTFRKIHSKRYLNQGSALACYNCQNLQIQNSSFQNLSSYQGGAIFLSQSTDSRQKLSSNKPFSISNSFFQNLSSAIGGAIYLDNIASTNLENTTFSDCRASISKEDLERTASGIAGVIVFSCKDNLNGCVLNITRGNNFSNNFAELKGGVIYWDQVEPIINLEDNHFFQNLASVYGNTFASFPQNLVQIKNEQFERYTLSQTQSIPNDNSSITSQDQIDEEDSQMSLLRFRSGGSLNQLYFALVDKYGQVVSTESQNYIQINVNQSFNSDSQANRYPPSLQGSNIFKFNSGVFEIQDLTFQGTPGYNYSLSFQTSALDKSIIQNRKYMQETQRDSLDFQAFVQLRECESGEQFTDSGKCEACINSFSITVQKSPGQCIACPINKAICPGGRSLLPKLGYWRMTTESETLIACENEDACLGSSLQSNNPLGECAQGYQGIICADCAADYSRSGNFRCSKCPSQLANIIKLILVSLAIAILFILLIRSTLRGAIDKNNISSIYVKMMINHFQLLLMTTSIEVNWSKQIKSFIYQTNEIAVASTHIFSLDCFLKQKNTTNSEEEDLNHYHLTSDVEIRLFYIKLILISLTPFLIIFGCVFVWFFINLVTKVKEQYHGKIISSVVIGLFLAHSNIVQFTFSAFNCIQIEDHQRLRNDLEITCWNGDHRKFTLMVALPSMLLWGLGIPLLALALLLFFKQNLNETRVRQRFGFLYRGFKDKFYFWEIIILYRKILIIFIAVFIKVISSIAQSMIVIIIFFVFLVVTLIYTPFIRRNLNYLECLSLLSSLVTIYIGLLFQINKPKEWMKENEEFSQGSLTLDDQTQLALFIIIILINVAFFIYWVYSFYKEIINRFVLKYSKLYLWVCLCGKKYLLDLKVSQQQMVLENEICYQRLQYSLDNIQQMYKRGEIMLNEENIKRIEMYLSKKNFLSGSSIKESISSSQAFKSKKNKKSSQFAKTSSNKNKHEAQRSDIGQGLNKSYLLMSPPPIDISFKVIPNTPEQKGSDPLSTNKETIKLPLDYQLSEEMNSSQKLLLNKISKDSKQNPKQLLINKQKTRIVLSPPPPPSTQDKNFIDIDKKPKRKKRVMKKKKKTPQRGFKEDEALLYEQSQNRNLKIIKQDCNESEEKIPPFQLKSYVELKFK